MPSNSRSTPQLSTNKRRCKKQVQSQVLEETERNSIIIFTDGSSIPEQGVGAEALIVNTTRNKTRFISTTESISNFEAELMGIQLAVDLIQEEKTMNTSINSAAIFSDNQGAFIKSTNPYYSSRGQHIYVQTFNKLRKLKGKIEITLYWCPGHKDIEDKCKVDELAKEDTSNKNINNQDIIPSSLSKLQLATKLLLS
ncbi:hypothetical protein O181_074822 [Austropuccinia psidii MF-1]|uniref:RNase H type-1 domain-containing protein n=1 Tax=Austropuccinia psidii MF-1 TaxID=1389203 RepID=A0A9Q3ICB3_9BASI|nr:hypothetical protein [Austropuccinia psidii MF-1]